MDKKNKLELSDIGEYAKKEILKIVYPECINEIKEIVKQSITDKIPLYPISTGKNWGLGSSKPIKEKSILVNLSRINKIRKIDLDMGYAIVETGVTQADLFDKLKNSPYMLNVTRSIAETSIIANTLERGLGSFRQKSQDLLAIEIITGKAKLVKCGSFWSTGRENMIYSHGIGPELTHLFMQSNFAITTAAAIKLIKRPQHTVAMEMDVSDKKLPDFIMSIRQLFQDQNFFGVLRIFNNESTLQYNLSNKDASKSYKLIAAIAGTNEMIKIRKRIIKGALSKFTLNGILSTSLDSTIKHPEYLSYLGTPNTESVTNIFGVKGNTDLDFNSSKGFLAFVPIIPFHSKDLRNALKILTQFEKIYKVNLSLTINIFSETSLYLAIFIYFERTLKTINLIHKIFNELKSAFISKGYFPYRIDIDSHNDIYFQELYGDTNYREILRNLKRSFDPNNIISPGRYIDTNE